LLKQRLLLLGQTLSLQNHTLHPAPRSLATVYTSSSSSVNVGVAVADTVGRGELAGVCDVLPQPSAAGNVQPMNANKMKTGAAANTSRHVVFVPVNIVFVPVNIVFVPVNIVFRNTPPRSLSTLRPAF
jgi:hypothetical protein